MLWKKIICLKSCCPTTEERSMETGNRTFRNWRDCRDNCLFR